MQQKSPKKRKKKKSRRLGGRLPQDRAGAPRGPGGYRAGLAAAGARRAAARRTALRCLCGACLAGTTAADLRTAFERYFHRARVRGIGGPCRNDDVALLPRAPSEFVRQVLDAQSYTTGEGTMRLEDVSVVATASDGLPFDFDRVEKRGEVRHAPWCFQEIAPRLASRMCVLRVDDEGAWRTSPRFSTRSKSKGSPSDAVATTDTSSNCVTPSADT